MVRAGTSPKSVAPIVTRYPHPFMFALVLSPSLLLFVCPPSSLFFVGDLVARPLSHVVLPSCLLCLLLFICPCCFLLDVLVVSCWVSFWLSSWLSFWFPLCVPCNCSWLLPFDCHVCVPVWCSFRFPFCCPLCFLVVVLLVFRFVFLLFVCVLDALVSCLVFLRASI